ncbi:MAG: AAA family ATPase [Patescibacteria group bacterium]|nr:AAA family ATPase [Patescibacteria group bacterium]
MPKLILGFAGKLASGKAVCQKYISEKHDAGSARFSASLRDTLNRLYLPISRENMQNLSLDFRNRFGSDILARVIAEDVKNDQHEIVIVDGVRRLEDVSSLRELPNFFLISIDAKPELRYERMKARNENAGDAEKSYEDFIEDGQREAELQIPEVMKSAHFHLDNNGDFDNLYKQIDKILEEIQD